MYRVVTFTVILGILPGTVGNAEAVPIMYTEQIIGTGTLGSSTFTNALITITFTGDTDNVFTPVFGVLANSAGTAVVAVPRSGCGNFD